MKKAIPSTRKPEQPPSPALYRRLALALPGVVEASHMGAPDFRINGRIFATLAYAAKGLGTVMLTPEQQAAFLADAPELFLPAPGGWARSGATLVHLDAPEAVLAGALSTAYHHILAKTPKPHSVSAKMRKPRLQ